MTAAQEFHLGSTPLRPGITLLEASAGTGKTYTISGIAVRLIVIDELPLRSILVVTFTEAATLELRERIRQRLMDIADELAAGTDRDPVIKAIATAGIPPEIARRRIALALASFDEAAISTIHGFCQRLLRDNAFEGNAPFEADVITDSSSLLLDAAHDFWQRRHAEISPVTATLIRHAKLAPGALVSLLTHRLRNPDLFILPEPTLSSAAAMTALQATDEQLRQEWSRERLRLLDLFANHPGIGKSNKESFGPVRLQRLAAALDAWATSAELAPDTLDAIAAMTVQAIEGARKKSKKIGDQRFPDDEFFVSCSRSVELRRAWVSAIRHEWLQFAATTLPQLKAARSVMSFDDMLIRTREALSGHHANALLTAVRQQYRAALIDEFQDTDPVQYEIFRQLFAEPPQLLMLIGDPKQSIYGFRGADLFTYLQVQRELQNAQPPRIYTLRTNFRSAKSLVDAVNELFSRQPDCFVQRDIRFLTATGDGERAARTPLRFNPGAGAPMVLVTMSESDEEADLYADETREYIAVDIAIEIRRLLAECRLGDRTVMASDIAVLVRSHRDAAGVEETLRALGIPSVRRTQENVFESTEADELLRILAAVLEPANVQTLRTALTAPCFGLTANDLLQLESNPTDWAEWIDSFASLRDRWFKRGFASMFRELLVRKRLRSGLLAQLNGERKLTNLLHLAELAQEAEHHDHRSPAGVIAWLHEQRANPSMGIERHVQRLDKDDEAVRIVTIHNAKGLEYPIVFCPSHWSMRSPREVLFHEREPPHRMTLDLEGKDNPSHKRLAAEEMLAEDVRLLYVAVTRAVHRCYLYIHQPKGDVSALVAVLGQNPSAVARNLARQNPDRITSRVVQRSLPPPIVPDVESTTRRLTSRELRHSVEQTLMVGSFSRLVAGAAEEQAQDHDDLAADGKRDAQEPAEIPAIFRLPRGAATGTALHAVLEHVDFREPSMLAPLVDQCFAALLLADDMRSAITAQLEQLLGHPLQAADRRVRLAEVSPADRINEAEFYYPIRPFTARELASVCRLSEISIPHRIERLQFSPIDGFMRGFMDLVFRHEGRYYLADWKSNWLGNSTADYTPGRLEQVMVENFYHLQSWLYALALDRFLAHRLTDYRYEDHFGGIFYVFVRGLDRTVPERGVHFARPSSEFMSALGAVVFGSERHGEKREGRRDA